MNTDWHGHCNLSLVHFMAFPECQDGNGPIVDSIGQIVEDGFFSAIEISWINNPKLRTQIAQMIEQAGMHVSFGAHPIILQGKLNLNSLDPNERAHARETLKPYIDQASDMGAQSFVIMSGQDPAKSERRAATEALIDSIMNLCEYANRQNVSITLETFDREVDKKALIGPAKDAADLAIHIKSSFPNFGLLYDMGHMPLLDEFPLPALTTLRDHLVHVHVGNCVKVPGRISYGDLHPRFGFPGSENDVPELVEFIRSLFQIGYLHDDTSRDHLPWIGFEVKPQEGETSSTILDNIKRTWIDAWDKLVETRLYNAKGSDT